MEGNAVVILSAPTAAPFLKALPVDRLAYPVLQVDNVAGSLQDAADLAGIVGPVDKLPGKIQLVPGSQPFVVRPVLTGPVPIIVDQSVLPGGKPTTEVTSSVRAVARKIAAAMTAGKSLGKPSYVLAHENLAPALQQALESALPQVKVRLEPLLENQQKATAFLSALRAGSPDFLPVYTVRSIDSALDFVQDDLAAPPIAYVFADRRFGAYAFNSLRQVPAVYINEIPEAARAVGPYERREDFSFQLVSHGSVARIQDTATERSAEEWIAEASGIKGKKLAQSAGKRIDFFGGGESEAIYVADIRLPARRGFDAIGTARRHRLRPDPRCQSRFESMAVVIGCTDECISLGVPDMFPPAALTSCPYRSRHHSSPHLFPSHNRASAIGGKHVGVHLHGESVVPRG